MDKNKNEELQSRREFFKSAAKAALPVLGAVVLSSLPIQQAEAQGCMNGCYGGCRMGCTSCYGSCWGSCMQHCTAMNAGY